MVIVAGASALAGGLGAWPVLADVPAPVPVPVLAPGAEPDTQVPGKPGLDGRWVLGFTLGASPSYSGASDRRTSLRPVLAGQIGRWTVSSSAAKRLTGAPLAGGISTTVMASERWQLGLGLRVTQGRSSADDGLFDGMPDVAASLAVRASAAYALTPDWRLTSGVQQDVLRSQGMRANVGLAWSRPLVSGWTLDASTGLTWADARAMGTYYGVSTSQSRPGRPAWHPGAGLEQWHWGVGVSRALSTHWRVSANAGRSTLVGQAARSPLTRRPSGSVIQVSLAYVRW